MLVSLISSLVQPRWTVVELFFLSLVHAPPEANRYMFLSPQEEVNQIMLEVTS